MRSFLLGKSVSVASTVTDYSKIPDGNIAVFGLNNGMPKITSTGSDIKGEANIVLGRSDEKGGPMVVPVFPHHFSYVKGEYTAATKFKATYVVPTPAEPGDYSIIVVLKGTKFNERNKYTASVHVKNTTTTSAVLAKALMDNINSMGTSSKVKATLSGSTITIEAVNSGEDYVVLGADKLFGTDGTIVTAGLPAYGDADYIRHLASLAAAESGFEYTYQDYVEYLYPDYPFNPLKANEAEDVGFTIFTINFSEHRRIKTTDEAVKQIIQVAFPTGSTGIAAFEKICKGLAGEASADDEEAGKTPSGGGSVNQPIE